MQRNSSRERIHLINDLPHYYEIEDMIDFCDKYDYIYICGAAEKQEYLLKFFDNCGVKIAGYAVTKPENQCLTHYRQIPIEPVSEVIRKPGTGIILALPDRHYRHIIPKFREVGFEDYFIMTEYNKHAISEQMKPRQIDEMTFEINLADHCNLSCQMCDHYSQLSEEKFVDIGVFERDLTQMGKLFGNKMACITLLGGEPLLHDDIVKCMEITRREFPDAQIIILTNGLLLLEWEHSPKGNLWQACKDLKVHITVTVYPINFDYAALEKKAAEYGVVLGMSSNIHADEITRLAKITDKHTFDLSASVAKHYFVCCLYFNKFNVFKDGRYYMCPIAAHVGIFNKAFGQDLQLTDEDSLDIYKDASWKEFAQFSSSYVPFCRYCDIKKWHSHSQWKASTKEIDEYV